ncbi:MAG TPA: nicotinamide-nucleotide amidohydrolase family protein, partial [Sphingomicrobium sp.]
VTYSKESKAELLGIDRDVLDRNDAVSEVVARAMADGALKRSEADLAFGITGFAGPGAPGQEEGLVHIALAHRDGAAIHCEEHFGKVGRGAVRVKSLKAMLDMLEQAIDEV